jgi:membrane protein
VTRLEYIIYSSKPIVWFKNYLRSIVLPGFQGISLFESLNFFRKEIFSARFNDRASAVSFKFILALPPTLLLLFTLIPYLPISGIDKTINDIILLITPNAKTQKNISEIVTGLYKHKKNTLLSFSLLLTLYYSSNGMMGLMRQFNKALPGFRKRNVIKRRGMAVVLTGVLLLSIIITASYFIFQKWAFDSIGIKALQKNGVIKFFSYIMIITMIFASVASIYRFGPALKNKWKWITPGSILATALIVISTFLLNWAVNNLVNYSKIYGSIGTLIVFILWIFYNAQILLIGFELNVSIMVQKDKKELDEPIDLAKALPR